MKVVISWLLLLAAGLGVFQATFADVCQQVPYDLIEKLKIEDNLLETLVPVKANEAGVNELLAIPPELVEEQLSAEHAAAANDVCLIKIRSVLTNPQPVYLKTNENEFYPFSELGDMKVPANETLQMFCSNKFKSFPKTLVTATCVNGSTFRVDGTNYKFSDLICQSWPDFVVKKTESVCNGGTLLKVGFQVSSTRFVEQMQVCFDENVEVTRYVYHKLQPGSNFFQIGVKRSNFQTNGFFGGKDVNKLYTQKSQFNVINNDLGGGAKHYFNTSKNVFLARGHLSAKADWMYGSQQRATFSFVNVAPQWQGFNGGNWNLIEDGVRAWVSKNKMHVACYTGVWGITTLPNKDGQETPLYLAYDGNNNGLIPVPKLYFRVVIEPETERGIVFIGVNNPHLTLQQIKDDYIICEDVSSKVDYIKWKKSDIIAGYSYACEVADFANVVKELPDLSAAGGLLV